MARRRSGTKRGVFRHSLESSKLLRKVPKAMTDLRKELLDYSDAFREMPPIFTAGITENIASRGSSIGKTWKKSPEEYRERKAREGKGGRQLEYTKKLVQQLTSGGAKYRIRKRGMSWGTKKIPYARALHFGGFGFFAMSERMQRRLQAVMDRHSVKKMDRATAALRAADGQ